MTNPHIIYRVNNVIFWFRSVDYKLASESSLSFWFLDLCDRNRFVSCCRIQAKNSTSKSPRVAKCASEAPTSLFLTVEHCCLLLLFDCLTYLGVFFPAWFVFREPKRRAVYFPHHTNQLVASTCRLRSRVFNHTHTQCVDVLTSFSGCFIWLCACASLSLHDCWNQLLLVRLARKKQSSTQQFKLFLEHSAARRQEKGSDFRLPRKMATNVARSIICLSVFFHWVIVQCSL